MIRDGGNLVSGSPWKRQHSHLLPWWVTQLGHYLSFSLFEFGLYLSAFSFYISVVDVQLPGFLCRPSAFDFCLSVVDVQLSVFYVVLHLLQEHRSTSFLSHSFFDKIFERVDCIVFSWYNYKNRYNTLNFSFPFSITFIPSFLPNFPPIAAMPTTSTKVAYRIFTSILGCNA